MDRILCTTTTMSYLIILLLTLIYPISAQSTTSCSSYTFTNNKQYATCTSLPYLNSYLHWTYSPSTSTINIAFRATSITPSSQWVAWAINPTSTGMSGAQALVAHMNSSSSITAYTSSVTSTAIATLTKSDLSFTVNHLSAQSTSSEIIIFANVTLPNNKTTVNQVWQIGPLTSSNTPSAHQTSTSSPNLKSSGSLNLLSGQNTVSSSNGSKQRKRNVHGVLNAVSWGTLLPIGAITARYLRVFKSADPAWFYLHITIQCSAYIIGVAGWGTGLKLGSQSPGIVYHTHRNIGISLFVLATLQVFALLLRPNKDHKHRVWWNVYHHGVGYVVIVLSIVNVFKGLDILDPDKKWKRVYVGVIIGIGCVAVCLEVFTWGVVLKRRRKEKNSGSEENNNKYTNGRNHGYGVRPDQQQAAVV